eukprot:scaffold2315_cov113-Cylindrotheca_fusiformis.AAC.18
MLHQQHDCIQQDVEPRKGWGFGDRPDVSDGKQSKTSVPLYDPVFVVLWSMRDCRRIGKIPETADYNNSGNPKVDVLNAISRPITTTNGFKPSRYWNNRVYRSTTDA